MVVILSYSRSNGRTVAPRDCGEVDLGVVDAVEDVGEDGGRESQADLDQLRVGVAGGLDRGEILVADRAARLRELADEADQRITLGVAGGLTLADLLEHLGLDAGELGEVVVGGDAIVAAAGGADDELDDLLIALGQGAGSERGVGEQDRLQRAGAVGGDGREGVRHATDRLLDLGVNLARRASVGFEIGD